MSWLFWTQFKFIHCPLMLWILHFGAFVSNLTYSATLWWLWLDHITHSVHNPVYLKQSCLGSEEERWKTPERCTCILTGMKPSGSDTVLGCRVLAELLPGEMKKVRHSFLSRVTSRISLVMLTSRPATGGTLRKSRILRREREAESRSCYIVFKNALIRLFGRNIYNIYICIYIIYIYFLS